MKPQWVSALSLAAGYLIVTFAVTAPHGGRHRMSSLKSRTGRRSDQ